MNNKVYVVKCPSYDQVEEKIGELLEMMGGMERFAAPDENIALKANLLVAADPEKAITTHPTLAAAIGRLTKDQGANAFIIDSPSGAYQYSERTLKRVYRACGMSNAAQEAGITLNFDTTYQPVSFPEGKLVQHFDILTPLVKADKVFNLCKLKTHTLMTMTGAVKNIFGAIPGRAKPGFHANLQDPPLFAQMLLDLANCVAPRLSIMDAVVGMEGDGPSNGQPRHIGLLLASENPLALDVVAGEIIGLPSERNPILVEAKKRGALPYRLEDIDLIGIDPSELCIPNFILPATFAAHTSWLLQIFSPLIKKLFSLEPRIVKDDCIACGDCREICPMQAITIQEDKSNAGKKYAVINYDECIHCYCCHEVCPQDAIELRKSFLYRIFNTLNV